MLVLLKIFLVIVLSLNLNKKTNVTGAYINSNVEIMVSMKYLSNFWKTLEMSLINCETKLTWSANCVIPSAPVNQATTFVITDTKLYFLVATLSSDDNGNLLQQLKSAISCNYKNKSV